MKNINLIKLSVGSLLCLLIVITNCNANENPAEQVPLSEKNAVEKSIKSFQDPIEYVLKKLEICDLVMIGERHWTHEEPVFIQNLIKRCYEKNAIKVVFLEFGRFADQGKIDAFMAADKYDPKPIIDILRDSDDLGWGYQEYFDIFKLIYDENHKRPSSEQIKLVLAWISQVNLCKKV